MGGIKTDVQQTYFSLHNDENITLKAFLGHFYINYADKKTAANTSLSAYIMMPDPHIKEAFGLEKEVLVLYSKYPHMEPRAIQASELLLQSYPFKGRVDNLNYILISDDPDVESWLDQFSFGFESTRIIIPLSAGELAEHGDDAWFVRNRLRKYFFDKDLFGYTLPLNEDLYFFGRQQIISKYIDCIRRGENRGIFGLRKTGKTSFLFKIQRIAEEQNIGKVFFFDCKLPLNRKQRWFELLREVCTQIQNSVGVSINHEDSEIGITKWFTQIAKHTNLQQKKIILIFDEVEFISSLSRLDAHWKADFVDFWQTIWSVQSKYRNLVFLISGVNPSVVEQDTVNGVQNPLFGIVQCEYLKGLTEDEIRVMIHTLGKRMGLRFDHEAISFIYKQYGGHPLLTRMACSWLNTFFSDTERPVDISQETIRSNQDELNASLSYYFGHVVSEIKEFYPEEYEMFELLAAGGTTDFMELSTDLTFVKHLYSYGLVEKDATGIPKISMPVAGHYVAMQLAARENRSSAYKLVEPDKRSNWVHQRCNAIIQDLRMLEKIISRNDLPVLFGVNSFPEADEFSRMDVSDSKNGFSSFINVCNRCFVESVQNYGNSQGCAQYFYQDIKPAYPALQQVLEKIKIYRHDQDHLLLKETPNKKLLAYLEEDLPKDIDDSQRYFCLQQKLLEDLFLAIQAEINRYT